MKNRDSFDAWTDRCYEPFGVEILMCAVIDGKLEVEAFFIFPNGETEEEDPTYTPKNRRRIKSFIRRNEEKITENGVKL